MSADISDHAIQVLFAESSRTLAVFLTTLRVGKFIVKVISVPIIKNKDYISGYKIITSRILNDYYFNCEKIVIYIL
jgi:hypothetical protein